MEMLLKIDKEADLPKFYKDTLMKSLKKEQETIVGEGKDKVILFPTCFVNYNNPNLGLVAKGLFQKLGIEHKFFYEMCCGMPQLKVGTLNLS